MEPNRFDVVVLGAGIAGLTAGIYLRRSNMSCLVLDKDAPGGKLNNIHQIDNYPGLPSVAGPDFAAALVTQAMDFGVSLDYGEVSSISLLEDGSFQIKTDNGTFSSLALIVSTGLINSPNSFPNEKRLRGRGVSYCATCDGNFFQGKDVLVYGYKDHAVEDAIYLSSLASKVYFLHEQPLETPPSHLETLESKSNVEILQGSLISIEGEETVEGALISLNGEEKRIPVSAIFPLSGEVSSSQFLATLKLEMTEGFIHVDEEMKTNVPGLFAAGDIVKKKLRQLVNAAGEGAVAATSAISYVHALKRKLK